MIGGRHYLSNDVKLISVREVYKSFGNIIALDGLSLDVEPGIFGLIGPNGAGKTTLIQILVGLVYAEKGRGQIFGLDIVDNSVSIRRRLGVLHERPAFPKHMKVQEYLNRVAGIYHSTYSSSKLLSKVGLADAEERRIGDLSAGMHQRLGIAQALIGNPELVILDEPTSNLDVIGRDDILTLIVQLYNEDDISFFISSHVLSELERVCHSIAFIKEGQVVEKGSVIDIVKKHSVGLYKIVTSDAQKVGMILDNMSSVSKVYIVGANTITVRMATDRIKDVQSEILQLAESRGIKVYEIEETQSLDEIFRRVIG